MINAFWVVNFMAISSLKLKIIMKNVGEPKDRNVEFNIVYPCIVVNVVDT